MVTYRLLMGMLRAKNQRFSSKTAWNSHLEEMYHLQLSTHMGGVLNTYELRVSMRMVQAAMVDDATLNDQALDALETLVLKPLFDAQSLAQEKQFLTDEWTTKRASKSFQAVKHLSEQLLAEHPYYTPLVESQAALDAVTLDAIHDAYHTLLSAPRVLMQLGPTDRDLGTEFLTRLPVPKAPMRRFDAQYFSLKPLTLAPLEDRMKQTIMFDVYETHMRDDDPDRDALMILNQLLGGDSESMLFKTIRETHNMAYSVGSVLISQYGMLMIQGMISPHNQTAYQEAVYLLMDQLLKGDYAVDDLELAKQSAIERIKRNHDARSALMGRAFNHVYRNQPFDQTARINTIRAIDQATITNVAQKLTYVTSFQYGAAHANSETA